MSLPVHIPIPVGIEHTATVSGSAAKAQTCEECGTVYYFEVSGTASGKYVDHSFLYGEFSKDVALRQAEKALKQTLSENVHSVACPKCGRIPIALVRRDARRRAGTIAAVGLTAAFLLK